MEGVQLLCLIGSPFNAFSMFLISLSAGGGHLSTTKMVATKLIAEGQLWEGVQLLCLIGKVADACTYLKASKVSTYVPPFQQISFYKQCVQCQNMEVICLFLEVSHSSHKYMVPYGNQSLLQTVTIFLPGSGSDF